MSDVLSRFYKEMDHEIFLGSDSDLILRMRIRPCSSIALEIGQLTVTSDFSNT